MSYITQNPLNPRLICFGAAGTVMGEILSITLIFMCILAIIVAAVLYLERHW
ncbi:small membrane protein YldA [Enterobacter wuhouensis]|uniref:small membrane protein YldA n=1 Tax=Enterobacter wuhouensis TaxID=2529381 RepID=UPI0037BFDC8C